MATYRGAAGVASNNSLSSLPVTLPAGWQPGDFCLIAGGVNAAGATFTDPAGWTLSEKGSLSSGGLSYFYYWRILQSGDTDPVVVSSVSAAYRYMSAAYTPAAGRKFQFDANGVATNVTTAGTSITPPSCSSRAAGSVSILVTMGRGSGTVTQTAFTNTPTTNYTNGNPFWGPSGISYTGHPFIVNQHNLNAQNISTLNPSAETVASTPANTYFMSSMHYNVTEVFAENWTAEGGTDATPITTGNSGGASGDVLDYASVGSGATLNYETAQKAHGSLSAAVAVGVTSTTSYFGYATAHSRLYARFYLRVPSIPTANTRIFGFYSSAPITTVAAFLRYATTGKLVVCDSASASQWTSVNNLPLNQWIRVEFWVYANATAGQFKISYYNTPDSDTATETFTSPATLNLGTTIASVIAGISIAQASVPKFWIDDLGFSNLEQPNVALSSGTGAVSLKKMSVAASGAGSSAFSGAVSMKKMGVAGSGTGSSSGSGAVKLKKMSIAGTGSVVTINDAVGNVKLKKMGVSGTGAGISSVTGAVKLKKMSVAGAGSVMVTVSGSVSLKKMGVSATATGISTASGGVTLKKGSISGSAAGISSAAGAVKLKKMGISGSASVAVSAAAAVAMKKMGVSGAVTCTSAASGVVGLKKCKLSGSGTGIAVLSGGPSLKKMGVSGAVNVITVGIGNVSLKKMGVSGTGPVTSVVSGAVSLKRMSVAGAGQGSSVTVGAVSMKKMKILGSGEKLIFVDGYVRMKKMGVAGIGTGSSALSGTVNLKKMSIAGFVTCRSATTGAISLKKMSIFGSGEKLNFVVVDVRMKKMGIAGNGAGVSALTGVIVLKKMVILGTGQGLVVVTGDVRLKKMRVSGSVLAVSVATGSMSLVKMAVYGEGSVTEAEVSDLSGNVAMKKMKVTGRGGELVTGRSSQLFIFSPL